jgi:hypothetical protein
MQVEFAASDVDIDAEESSGTNGGNASGAHPAQILALTILFASSSVNPRLTPGLNAA